MSDRLLRRVGFTRLGICESVDGYDYPCVVRWRWQHKRLRVRLPWHKVTW